jgi:hypothetical protein
MSDAIEPEFMRWVVQGLPSDWANTTPEFDHVTTSGMYGKGRLNLYVDDVSRDRTL